MRIIEMVETRKMLLESDTMQSVARKYFKKQGYSIKYKYCGSLGNMIIEKDGQTYEVVNYHVCPDKMVMVDLIVMA